jgi:hypothetical protein
MENLKLLSEMKLKKEGKNGIPPTYMKSKALNEKLLQPNEP